jgi:hypothetical protein
MQNKRIIFLVIAVACILLVPFFAMQFTDEVAWDLVDFAVAGTLLLGTGLGFELAMRKTGNTAYRAAVGVALAAALLLVWINLAVGIIGAEENPANLMYFGVFAIGVIGAFIARFQPQGMASAMFATALSQALVPVIALIIWSPQVDSMEALMDVASVFVLSAFFAMLFAGSALLFRRASHGLESE